MSSLRIADLRLSLRDKLTEAFDALDEDALYISQLEDRIAQLEARLAAPAPGGGS